MDDVKRYEPGIDWSTNVEMETVPVAVLRESEQGQAVLFSTYTQDIRVRDEEIVQWREQSVTDEYLKVLVGYVSSEVKENGWVNVDVAVARIREGMATLIKSLQRDNFIGEESHGEPWPPEEDCR